MGETDVPHKYSEHTYKHYTYHLDVSINMTKRSSNNLGTRRYALTLGFESNRIADCSASRTCYDNLSGGVEECLQMCD